MIAKCARTSTDKTRRSLRRQYFALEELHQKAHGPLAESIPCPVAISEDDSVLIMSRVQGTSLNSILRRKANSVTGWRQCEALKQTGKSLGRWLMTFHSLTSSCPQAHRDRDYRNQMEVAYSNARAFGISEAVLVRVREAQERLSWSQENAPVPVSASHGEFLPQNILIYGTKVGVVDFDTFNSAAPVHRDIATFLAYIGSLAGKLKYSRTALIYLAEGFMSGYGNDFNLPLLKSEFLNSSLRLAYESNSGGRSRLNRQTIERDLTHAVIRILDDINSTRLF